MNNKKQPFLVITSIATDEHKVLKQYASESLLNDVGFIVIGDKKSPSDFHLNGCDFFSLNKQAALNFKLSKNLPIGHYARKNLGYLIAISRGAEIIIETDDDNLPKVEFWEERKSTVKAYHSNENGWVNTYKWFTDSNIWPRGFLLDKIHLELPDLGDESTVFCPIQQGLADSNPDVDAIYRLVLPLPINFNSRNGIALGKNSICPFNSQNTTWFKEAFPLMYLPSFCSFRMTDIWRSFVAQRIAWTCGWSILFHNSTVWQERNEHRLMNDFVDEISGYVGNEELVANLLELELKMGVENIPYNMTLCYNRLIEKGFIGSEESELLNDWLEDINNLLCAS